MIIVGKKINPASKSRRVLVLGKPKVTGQAKPQISASTGGAHITAPPDFDIPPGVESADAQTLLDGLEIQRNRVAVDRAILSNSYVDLEARKTRLSEFEAHYMAIEEKTKLLNSLAQEKAYVLKFGKSSKTPDNNTEGIRMKVEELKNKKRSLINIKSKANVKLRKQKVMGSKSIADTELKIATTERQIIEINDTINALQNG